MKSPTNLDSSPFTDKKKFEFSKKSNELNTIEKKREPPIPPNVDKKPSIDKKPPIPPSMDKKPKDKKFEDEKTNKPQVRANTVLDK